MKHIFIINPSAGKGNKVKKLIEEIKTVCNDKRIDFDIYITKEIGDAERYVRTVCEESVGSNRVCRFYACGGDGTINECANGMVDYEKHELGVIPIGTGNDFVRNFGDRSAFYDLEAQLEGFATSCDLIKYNDRYCVNVLNIGLDCEVVVRTNRIKRNALVPSKLAYIIGLVGEFVRKKGIRFRCVVDGEDKGDNFVLLAFFANGGYYGGGFHAAPLSTVKDSVIDMCFIKDISRLKFLNLVGKYKNGTYLNIKNGNSIFDYKKCNRVEIEFDKPEDVCIDGEIEVLDRISMEIVKNKINISVPRCFYEEDADLNDKKEKIMA